MYIRLMYVSAAEVKITLPKVKELQKGGTQKLFLKKLTKNMHT